MGPVRVDLQTLPEVTLETALLAAKTSTASAPRLREIGRARTAVRDSAAPLN
jgi:hypothetical protein